MCKLTIDVETEKWKWCRHHFVLPPLGKISNVLENIRKRMITCANCTVFLFVLDTMSFSLVIAYVTIVLFCNDSGKCRYILYCFLMVKKQNPSCKERGHTWHICACINLCLINIYDLKKVEDDHDRVFWNVSGVSKEKVYYFMTKMTAFKSVSNAVILNPSFWLFLSRFLLTITTP